MLIKIMHELIELTMLFFKALMNPPNYIFRPVQESQRSTIYYRPSLMCEHFSFHFKRDLPVNNKIPLKYM